MKALPKSLLLPGNSIFKYKKREAFVCLLLFVFYGLTKGQSFINLVPNGSFETYTSCPSNSSQVYKASPWTGPTSNSTDFFHACASPNKYGTPYYNGVSSPYPYYQPAFNGGGYAGIFTYQINYREYLQVQLTSTLETSKCYYVEFYAVNGQTAKYYNNNVAANFSNIQQPTNLSNGILINAPQHITRYGNPVITDTINWQKISGLYTAAGNENYITIGNFKDDSNTDTVNIYAPGTTYYYMVPCSYVLIDAVSVYSINPTGNLPWSYRDTTIMAGDSVYIGNYMGGSFNPSWYTYAGGLIANNAGIYVKPNVTSKYIVDFTICGVPRKDTIEVVVNSNIGIKELKNYSQNIKLYPQPTENVLTIELAMAGGNFSHYILYNNLGEAIRNDEIVFDGNKASIATADLAPGIYLLFLKNNSFNVTKRFIVARK